MGKKAKIALLILLIGLILFLYFAYRYFNFVKEYATTDAIFIKSERITNVSFKRVGGRIVKLNYKEGDKVNEGDVLAEIDPTDYLIKLKGIKKEIESLIKQREKLKIEIKRIHNQLSIKKENARKKVEYLSKEINAVKYSILELQSNIDQLKTDYNRFKKLYEEKAIAKRKFEDIETKLSALKNRKLSLLSKIKGLKKEKEIAINGIELIKEEFRRIDEIKKAIESLNKKIEALKQKEKDAENLIEYCKIKAPFDGYIGKKFVEIGSVIDTGYPVYSIVDTKSLYVEVLLEETKMKGVKVGSKAYFTVDAYPDKEFTGEVEAIYPASAATYALVPRDISAGEFTKVAQRIPIKVKILNGNLELLKVGMGGEIRIKRIQ